MTRQVLILAAARRDLKAALDISKAEFGLTAHAAYKRLIDRAFADLAEDPARPGVRDLSEVRPGVLGYHLRFSRAHVAGERVRRPRHVVLFRLFGEDVIVARLLHERMLPSRHL